MKLVLTALSIALATSAVSAAAAETPAPASASAEAPSADRLDLARRFIALTNSPETVMNIVRESSMQAASAEMEGIEDEETLTLARQGLETMLAELDPQIRRQMPNVLEAYAQAYAREFAADELGQMIAFAETAAGKHYLARYALVDNDPLVIAAHLAMWEELAPTMERVRKQLCSERAAQRLAAGDTDAKCSLG